jgi:hypothetical protein
MCTMPVPPAPAIRNKVHFQIEIVPADGTKGSQLEELETSVVGLFWGSTSDKLVARVTRTEGTVSSA